jgi:putative DNA methylase
VPKDFMTTTNDKRLIEVAFPLKQTSIDSVHEKNVRHGHISTLHIWPARRPLAASRAALVATLLPDPGDRSKRDEILKRLGGTLKKTLKKKVLPNGRTEEIEAWETEGGILRWGRESGPDLQWFRDEIRKAYGGRAPKVLDPFAGGGAIPLEAMRLGCEVTAVDINPVAWFILKCTLEYPQKLAGQKRRLPDFAMADPEFMAGYLKARGLGAGEIRRYLQELGQASESGTVDMFEHKAVDPTVLDADLAWHVRAWGLWVLKEARQKLARYYPTYAEFCTVKPYNRVPLARSDDDALKLVPTNDAGETQEALLNSGYSAEYLENPKNPRWTAKPTVAYLWARTVKCKACRATLPLLKTRWLCKKDNKRVVLTMQPNAELSGVVFGIDAEAKAQGGNAAQKREYDKKLGFGTMTRSGASCPCCGTVMTMEDLRLEGRAGRLGAMMTAVVMDSPGGKEYRLPTAHEINVADQATDDVDSVFADVPHGLPREPTPKAGLGAARAFSVDLYGLDQWHKIFLPRQLVALGSIIASVRSSRLTLNKAGYDEDWTNAIGAALAVGVDRVADRGSCICRPDPTPTQSGIINTFSRFALPITWDFAEGVSTTVGSGGLLHSLEWVARYFEHSDWAAPFPQVLADSAATVKLDGFDVVVTDPPYYDAIPYSDLMDFFYVWLRRTLFGLSPEFNAAFSEPLSPKWSHDSNDGELIDDATRFAGDKQRSKRNYEEGMARAFVTCHNALNATGRLVIVFAHKHPDAWETLVAAIIRAGFVVDGSWPIQTEMGNRTRAQGSAALSSSVWLVCRKRDPMIKAGWDEKVLAEMQINVTQQLRDFWDAGIRGPDFVWSATGPALEAYSRYPAVKKASEPGALMSVTEFLGHVRRMVVDFVVGRVLTRGESETVGEHPLDDVTTYYLLHRNDFGLKEAPAGACILYAVSCGLSERELADQYGLLSRGGSGDADDDESDEEDESASSGSMFKLKVWSARKHRNLGLEAENGRPPPMVDQIHKLMQLWQAGDVNKVNDFLDARGQRKNPLFAQLVQALIEKSRDEKQMEECALLERLANHLRGLGATVQGRLALPHS